MCIHKFQNIILLLMAIVVFAACDRNTPILEQMDMAENLMNTKPDSALTLLKDIPVTNIKGKEIAARYALLKSMALDKNYIDTTTFDVLQPAIDYYLKKGSPDEKLRTYYYQGRIYQNQGDDDSAMQSFLNAIELRQKVTDSLILAHTFVAQGTLYFKQYKTNEFIRNNLEAAKLYGVIGRDIFEIKSYTNALDGYIILNNKSAADSLLSICIPLVQKNPDGEVYLFPSLLSYTIEFCSPDDLKTFLDKYQDLELSKDETMNFARGYSKIGEYDKALNILAEISPAAFTMDSLKYASVKIEILEKQGKYEQALNLYRDYSAMHEGYLNKLISHDLLFSDKKHQLEMENLMKIQDRDRIIWATLCGIFALTILVGWLYYRAYRSKTRRILAEKENENLKLEQDNLRKEKEKAELERDKKTLEAENLEKDKKRLEAEQRQYELEAANLRLEISQLESERDHLKELQKEQSELAKPIQKVIKDRLVTEPEVPVDEEIKSENDIEYYELCPFQKYAISEEFIVDETGHIFYTDGSSLPSYDAARIWLENVLDENDPNWIQYQRVGYMAIYSFVLSPLTDDIRLVRNETLGPMFKNVIPENEFTYIKQSMKSGEELRYALILANVNKKGLQKLEFIIRKL